MSEKSRVILYENLRKKISDMEVYSFEDEKRKQQDEKKGHGQLSVEKSSSRKENSPDEEAAVKGIQNSTLSMSIDELIDEQNQLVGQTERKQAKKEFHRKKERKRFSVFNLVIWILCAVLVLVFFIIILVLLFR